LVVSVYVAGKDEDALRTAIRQLGTTIASFRNSTGKRTDIILAGDFNRHDQLWGGDEVTGRRQGEAGPIIDIMDEYGLINLLPRGTKTWEGLGGESTIDLTLASAELAEEWSTAVYTRPNTGQITGPSRRGLISRRLREQ
jgi:hypothetical protein